MRFAYIDSQGNEVPIPSIDALALRIELGAVGPETELYDAQADHWGPARTHEIFHSLSRAAGEEGFMAPPPPVAPPSAGPPAAASKSPSAAAPVAPKATPRPEPEEEEEADGGFDLGLTLADPVPEPEEGIPAAKEGSPPEFGLDLAPPPESLVPEAPAEEAGGGFDFGDLGSGLELEGSVLDDDDDDQALGGFGGGMGLETEMEFGSPGADFAAGGGDLQLEEPMSAFEPDTPPGWMEESGADDVMDFSAVSAEEEAGQEAVTPVSDAAKRNRRTPKDRPSAPRFKSQRSMSGPIVSVVVLLALGVGGYVGWPMLSARLAERSAPDRPPVVMPSIPDELIPQMRNIGMAAMADVVAEVDVATRVAGAPMEPAEEWLAGVYLGNASRYPGIEAFWSSIDDFMQGMRAAEWLGYHDKYVERVAREGLAAEAAAQVTERADSGFVAAGSQRLLAYDELERLVDAALGLHDFLLANEAAIEFRPGATSTTDPNVDPVLEIAASQALRAQMLQMFDGITDSLDALGSLDRVTRERLTAALTARLQQVGLQ